MLKHEKKLFKPEEEFDGEKFIAELEKRFGHVNMKKNLQLMWITISKSNFRFRKKN
jgi:hypothetical protein